ncbi:MAG: J domain-containing protein [Pseudomonadota bacterium]
MAVDPYKTLGVEKSATETEIRSAYRRKAKALHPDLHPDDEAKAEEFKRVSAAWDILGDKDKRAKFDRGEIDADGNQRATSHPGGFRQSGSPFGGQHGDPFEDILSGMFGGGRTRRGPGPRKGRDIRYAVEIDFADAVTGARRRMTMADGKTLDVAIPGGIESGQTLRLKSQGQESPHGGPPGDALLEVTVRPSKVWTRDGNDLRMAAPIPLETAVLGGSVELSTPTGPVTLKVPVGSNTGRVLRLRGKGVKKGNRAGDLLARLEITLTDPDDSALKSFLKDLKT